MAFVVKDRVKVTSTTTGTGTFTLGAAAGISFQDFSVIGDGNTTSYTIVDPSTGAFEVGIGTFTASGTTLSRDAVLESSNSGSLVDFAVGLKEVFVTYPAERAVVASSTPTNGDILVFSSGSYNPQALPSSIPSGTVMLFVQTAAPTGFTKSTTNDNKALRVVSGTASTGGTVAFTTAFASKSVAGTVGNHTLTTAQLASHTHGVVVRHDYSANTASPPYIAGTRINNATNTLSTNSAGSGNAHNHSFTGTAIDLAVSYVDVIIATKD
jgi:hypothetical protein